MNSHCQKVFQCSVGLETKSSTPCNLAKTKKLRTINYEICFDIGTFWAEFMHPWKFEHQYIKENGGLVCKIDPEMLFSATDSANHKGELLGNWNRTERSSQSFVWTLHLHAQFMNPWPSQGCPWQNIHTKRSKAAKVNGALTKFHIYRIIFYKRTPFLCSESANLEIFMS